MRVGRHDRARAKGEPVALKSKEWFYKQCLAEVEKFTPFMHLSWQALRKGVGQSQGTRGHMTQAIGAVQEFFDTSPTHIASIEVADRTSPFELTAIGNAKMLKDWKTWLRGRSGPYGKRAFGYNYDTLKGIVTPSLGGSRTGGGGGDDELKTALRLVAHFRGRK
jgi:hypothetical protein